MTSTAPASKRGEIIRRQREPGDFPSLVARAVGGFAVVSARPAIVVPE